MICEFCSGVHDVDIEEHVAVDLYSYKGELVACCFNCLAGNLDIDVRQEIHLPNGWEVIKREKRFEIEKAEKAFIKAREVMIEYFRSKRMPGGYGYIYDMGSFFTRIASHLEKQIADYRAYQKTIGIDANFPIEPSGAYCPDCKSPLLKMATLPTKHAISIAATSIVKLMADTREKRNGAAFVCLSCRVAYVDNKPTKKKGSKS